MEDLTSTLVYLLKGDGEVYLARGKKGVVKGYLSGYGGKQDDGETIARCAVRETKEEAGVNVTEGDLHKCCVIAFHWDEEVPGLSRPGVRTVVVHVYRTANWEGEPAESDAFETADSFSIKDLPFDRMMPSYRYWLERALRSTNPFTAECHFTTNDGVAVVTSFGFHARPNKALLDTP